jgi:hypothetical protein
MGLAWMLGSLTQGVSGSLAKVPSLGPAGSLLWMGVMAGAALVLALWLPSRAREQPAVPGLP